MPKVKKVKVEVTEERINNLVEGGFERDEAIKFLTVLAENNYYEEIKEDEI